MSTCGPTGIRPLAPLGLSLSTAPAHTHPTCNTARARARLVNDCKYRVPETLCRNMGWQTTPLCCTCALAAPKPHSASRNRLARVASQIATSRREGWESMQVPGLERTTYTSQAPARGRDLHSDRPLAAPRQPQQNRWECQRSALDGEDRRH